MSLIESPHQASLKEGGWHSRGYLPHFDGRAIPQFVTLRLYDSIPGDVLQRWMRELNVVDSTTDQITLQIRIEKYLDHGYGNADYFDRYIRNSEHFAKTVQYIENNPVKAQLCKKPEDWPFSSARFRERRATEIAV